MTVKTMELSLGTIGILGYSYQTGWYRDAATGQDYYYDAPTGQWYIYSAGLLYPLSITAEPAPKVVAVAPGDTLRITISYKYSGLAQTITERAAVGTYGMFGFDEKAFKSQTHVWPETVVPTLRTTNLDVVIPTQVAANWNDIYAKVSTPVIEAFFCYENALSIVGITPEFSDFGITEYVVVV